MDAMRNVVREVIGVLVRTGVTAFDATAGGRQTHVLLGNADRKQILSGYAQWTGPVSGTITAQSAPKNQPDVLMMLIEANAVGLTLKEMAAKLKVRPRNALKPALETLIKSRRVVKVGRLFRSASAVVRRGRPPNAATESNPIKRAKSGASEADKAFLVRLVDSFETFQRKRTARRS